MIVRVRLRWLRFVNEVRTAHGRLAVTGIVEVEAHTRGTVGFGEAATGYESGPSALKYLRACAPTDDVAAELKHLEAESGHVVARAALDAALRDLDGRLRGEPVWQLLGTAPASPPTSWTISLDAPAMMAKAAVAAPSGIRRLKLKLGGRDGRDGDRVRAVRAASDLPLRVDANEAWSLEEALEQLPALERLGVELCEQPLRRGDPRGERLKAESPLPIFLDEDCRTIEDLDDAARRGHGINVKLAKCGGIGPALRLIEAARAQDLGVMIGCMGESSLGIAAALQIASLCDYVDLDSNLQLANDPWEGISFADGAQGASSRPGLGVMRRRLPRGVVLASSASDFWRRWLRPVVKSTVELVSGQRAR